MLKFIARENTALVLSAIAAGLFALAGIIWGLWVDSLVILFDGAYSLVSLLLSLLSLYAARIIRRPACETYPFGLGAVEPLVIAVKGTVIALVCLLSMISAVASLVNGGRSVDASIALIFAGVSVVGCLAVWLYLKWSERRTPSGLVVAEHSQWLMDTVLSVAVLIGFGGAWWLEHSGWASLAVYADPVMMIVISGWFIVVPVKMAAGAVRELLLAAPSVELAEEVRDALKNKGIIPQQVKIAKVGSRLMLEINLPRNWPGKIDSLKRSLIRELDDLPVPHGRI
ncbi:MAG TPA: cation diffusion facilitator family transporter [Marinobacter sp.]|nr:cation diffusion facilitator family transporter [Marinobacter sp.]